jgi:hypothetical protein
MDEDGSNEGASRDCKQRCNRMRRMSEEVNGVVDSRYNVAVTLLVVLQHTSDLLYSALLVHG